MLIKIDQTYQGVGCIGISLTHENTASGCPQELKTTLRLTGDASTCIKALSGLNEEDGSTYIDLELQGIESIGALKVLYDSIGTLIKAVENN